jgi:hypothetical protein
MKSSWFQSHSLVLVVAQAIVILSELKRRFVRHWVQI